MEAGGTDASGIERVPFVSAVTRPAVVLAGRPAAEWATDPRTRWFVALFPFKLAIHNSVVRDGTHANLL
jgi:hypothetical protein